MNITKITRRFAVTLVATTLAGAALAGSPAEAAMTGSAVVECNAAYNTIVVTPRVLSDHANSEQYTATRVWIAAWNASTRTWNWYPQTWKVELARAQNSPIATDTSRLAGQSFSQFGDGYHYVYVESYMWNGSAWYGQQGQYTSSYTLVTPSVSHEPSSRSQSSYCVL